MRALGLSLRRGKNILEEQSRLASRGGGLCGGRGGGTEKEMGYVGIGGGLGDARGFFTSVASAPHKVPWEQALNIELLHEHTSLPRQAPPPASPSTLAAETHAHAHPGLGPPGLRASAPASRSARRRGESARAGDVTPRRIRLLEASLTDCVAMELRTGKEPRERLAGTHLRGKRWASGRVRGRGG